MKPLRSAASCACRSPASCRFTAAAAASSFRFESDGSAAETHVFVVGQASDEPGGALRPFPLDRGPGVVRELGQRELGLPA
jgi:hypothetical protein